MVFNNVFVDLTYGLFVGYSVEVNKFKLTYSLRICSVLFNAANYKSISFLVFEWCNFEKKTFPFSKFWRRKKFILTLCWKIWKLLNQGYHYNSEIYFYEFWSTKIKQKYQTPNILAMAPFRIFYGLKKCFMLPFSYLLTDLCKLWTNFFGFICFFTALQKNNKFGQK